VGGAVEAWPELPLEAWTETNVTLHMLTQIVGKVRLSAAPWVNHSWGVTLYVDPRGLTTSAIPWGNRVFSISFDFIDHRLLVRSGDGAERIIPLEPRPVAEYYGELLDALASLDLPIRIGGRPNEVEEAIPFAEDRVHASYDPEYVSRFWRALVDSERVMTRFRALFIGKASPVHFFWGGFDLAVTRFSGRRAPAHPGGIPNMPDWVAREAYSHEVCSAGFWPGGGAHPYPLFYSYAYPEPEGYREARVVPEEAFYSDALREFVLPYDAVRTASSPDDTLFAFLQSTYEAAAERAAWDRRALEWSGDPRAAFGEEA
jgi:hypothetical protein